MLWFLIEARKNDEYVTDLEAKTLDEAKIEIIRSWDRMTKDDHKRTTEFYAAFAETDEEDFIDYDSITETWDLLEKIKKIKVGITYEDETGVFEVTAVLSDTADVTCIGNDDLNKGKEYTVNKSEIAYYM